MENLKIFNRDALDAWREVDPNDWKTITKNILDLFLQIGEQQYQDLEQTWKNKNLDQLIKKAHTLKSSCGNVGAEIAHQILNNIEKNAMNLSQEEIEEMLIEFNKVFSEVKLQIKNYYATELAA